jgi:hypothetical protein
MPREILGPLSDQLKGPAQDLGAFPWRGPRPGRPDLVRPGDIAATASGLVAETRVASTSPVAGSCAPNVAPSDASTHCAPISRPVGTEACPSKADGSGGVGGTLQDCHIFALSLDYRF